MLPRASKSPANPNAPQSSPVGLRGPTQTALPIVEISPPSMSKSPNTCSLSDAKYLSMSGFSIIRNSPVSATSSRTFCEPPGNPSFGSHHIAPLHSPPTAEIGGGGGGGGGFRIPLSAESPPPKQLLETSHTNPVTPASLRRGTKLGKHFTGVSSRTGRYTRIRSPLNVAQKGCLLPLTSVMTSR